MVFDSVNSNKQLFLFCSSLHVSQFLVLIPSISSKLLRRELLPILIPFARIMLGIYRSCTVKRVCCI